MILATIVTTSEQAEHSVAARPATLLADATEFNCGLSNYLQIWI
jgi:hypothetical protein